MRLLTGKRLQRSHWNTVNINEDVIEFYDTVNTKGCPDELVFGNFNEKNIPFDYYNLLNDENDDDNNIHDTTVDNDLLYNEVVGYAVLTNDKEINRMTALPQLLTLSNTKF